MSDRSSNSSGLHTRKTCEVEDTQIQEQGRGGVVVTRGRNRDDMFTTRKNVRKEGDRYEGDE